MSNKLQYELIKLKEVTSTQTYLIDKDDGLSLQEFTTVYTTNQTLGRGQGEHKWESEKDKNISFSFVLRPIFLNPSNQYLITKIISLAIADVLQGYGIDDVKIKWPNDIYVKQNKICGILVQNKIIGNELSAVYVGIGININQKDFLLAPNPTSFLLEKGRGFDTTQVFNSCMQRIIHKYEDYRKGKLKDLDKEYLEKLLFFKEYHKYEYDNKVIDAKIIDVNEFGHLILQDKDATIYTAELREIKFLL